MRSKLQAPYREAVALLALLDAPAIPEAWLPLVFGLAEKDCAEIAATLALRKLAVISDGKLRLLAAARKYAEEDQEDPAGPPGRFKQGGGSGPEDLGGLAPFLRLCRAGRELEGLETLTDFVLAIPPRKAPGLPAALFRLLLCRARRIRIRQMRKSGFSRYVQLCQNIFRMSVCIPGHYHDVLGLIMRIRAAAVRHGEGVAAAVLEMAAGALNVLPCSMHNDARLHKLMERGYETLRAAGQESALETHAHLVGIYFFMEGKYRRAIDTMAAADRIQTSVPDVHARAQRGLLSAIAYYYLGESEQAHELLRRTLRQLPQPGYPTLARLIRAYIALVLISRKENESALERLDIALADAAPSQDLIGWNSLMRTLAVYHAARPERIFVAYTVLCNCMAETLRAGYARPLYLLPETLEMLDAMERSGLGPVPGYDLEKELETCLRGPNVSLRGVAFRLKAERLSRQGQDAAALEYFHKGIELFRALRAYNEVAKTRWALSRHHLERNEKSLSLSYAMEARLRMSGAELPDELAGMLPALNGPELRLAREPDFSALDLLVTYAESLHSREWNSLDELLSMLVASSCSILGMQRGCMFVYDKTMDEPRPVCQQYMDFSTQSPQSRSSALELVNIALSGTPVMTTVPAWPGYSGEASIICIPILCGPRIYVLYHDGVLPAWWHELIQEKLLAHIGKILAHELTLAERLPSGAAGPSPDEQKSIAEGSLARPGRGSAFAHDAHTLVAVSEVTRRFLHSADLLARSEASVYLSGETGSGKEVVARRIHALSGRKGAFVPVNLAGIPDELFENEILGHEKGAFTGASYQKPGLLEMADGGTLFLDELEEASPRAQTKLLRLLQERSFTRLGGTRVLRSDFRLITASNGDLAEAVAQGRFRKDLYYRICVARLHIPPLRERPEDIPAIAEHYLAIFSEYYAKPEAAKLGAPELERMLAYPWPGNVRELKNHIEQRVILYGSLAEPPGPGATPIPPAAPAMNQEGPGGPDPLQRLAALEEPPKLEELREQYIARILERTGGRIDGKNGAAELLGLSRSKLYAFRRRVHGE